MSLAVVTPGSGGVESEARTILVVDHRETIRRVLALILEAEGYQVVTTDAATAAMALAFELQPAAILLDLSLTEHTAIEAFRSLKSDARTVGVPVVLLTSCAEALSDADRALAAAVMTKPIDLDVLMGLMGRLVGVAIPVG